MSKFSVVMSSGSFFYWLLLAETAAIGERVNQRSFLFFRLISLSLFQSVSLVSPLLVHFLFPQIVFDI